MDPGCFYNMFMVLTLFVATIVYNNNLQNKLILWSKVTDFKEMTLLTLS